MKDLPWKKKMEKIQKFLKPWKDGTLIKMIRIEKEVPRQKEVQKQKRGLQDKLIKKLMLIDK